MLIASQRSFRSKVVVWNWIHTHTHDQAFTRTTKVVTAQCHILLVEKIIFGIISPKLLTDYFQMVLRKSTLSFVR